MTRFATWNVNSLKVRLARVEAWLADVAPDIVCLQETKLADWAFPALAFQSLGYAPPTTARVAGTASPSCHGSASTTCRSASPTTTSPTPRPA